MPALAGVAGALPRANPLSVAAGWARTAFFAERERWILWLPVLAGCGIALYFALPDEPPGWLGGILFATTAGVAMLGARWMAARHPLSVVGMAALAVVAAGFAAAQLQAITLTTRMLSEPIGPATVSGRVTDVENFPDGQRVTLDGLAITGANPRVIPDTARLRLRGAQPTIRPGEHIRLRAMLMPPPPPMVPGAYDFQRQAYFDRIGAVGYSIGKASVSVADSDAETTGLALWFARLRFIVAERVRAHLDGATAAVTLALLTGEQRAIPDETMTAIRNSGLAHLLSISGLHIGLVAGIVFIVIRSGLALVPRIALRWPIKKWAAVASVLAAGAYTLLAAAPVPSQRSFLMVAIVLLAVLVDRQGISMRLVAFAALVILLTQPESLLGPSFQMSFAAVVALIAAYEVVQQRRRAPSDQPVIGGRILVYLGGVILSTMVAGTATTPYAIYHFNRFQVYGVAANMLAVPVTSFWIMPWAVVAMLLMPFGLEGVGLVPMGWGVDAVIWIADVVAAWPGSVILLPPLPTWSLGLITLGGAWLCLWQGRWRRLGVIGIVAGAAGLLLVPPPDMLVDASGRLLAVRGGDGGLLFSSKSAGRSTREAWLRRSGEEVPLGFWPNQGASADGRLRCDALGCVYRAGGHVVAIARSGEALLEDCRRADVVLSLVPLRSTCLSARTVIDRFSLWRNGAHAIWLDGDRLRVESVNGQRGTRPWVIRAKEAAAAERAGDRAEEAADDGDDEPPASGSQ